MFDSYMLNNKNTPIINNEVFITPTCMLKQLFGLRKSFHFSKKNKFK